MTNRLITLIITVPLAIVLIVLSVANRGVISLTLDPFNPGNPAMSYHAPLFIWIFGSLLLGIIIGSALTWFSQRRHRKAAKQRKAETDALLDRARKAEAQNQHRAITAG